MLTELWLSAHSWAEPLVVIALAAVGAGIIGLDRELRGKPAGMRTNMVVGVAAAAFAYLSANAFVDAGGMADPGRVAAQVVSGIGFLGGGAIFAAGGKPHGLTTAAALWGSAAVGVCIGAGQFAVGLALVAITSAVLWPMDRALGRVLARAAKSHELYVLLDDLEAISTVRDELVTHGFEPRDVHVRQIGSKFQMVLTAHGPARPFAVLLAALNSRSDVAFVSAGSADAQLQ